jgi:hypothetical protein
VLSEEVLPIEDVRKAAAFGWYRTSLLCEQASQKVADIHPEQPDLHLQALGIA